MWPCLMPAETIRKHPPKKETNRTSPKTQVYLSAASTFESRQLRARAQTRSMKLQLFIGGANAHNDMISRLQKTEVKTLHMIRQCVQAIGEHPKCNTQAQTKNTKLTIPSVKRQRNRKSTITLVTRASNANMDFPICETSADVDIM